jgi:HEAT repeat protein
LIEIGRPAVPTLTRLGLKYAPGFADKRALVCQILGEIGDPDAVPALITTLRDPVVNVAAWACDSLLKIGDDTALPALQRYHQRLLSLAANGRIPADSSADGLIALAASTCYRFGDATVESDLVGLLLSQDANARATAYKALVDRYGQELEYDPNASPEDRAAAVQRWQAQRP